MTNKRLQYGAIERTEEMKKINSAASRNASRAFEVQS